MIVEIRGVGTINKGAHLMLKAISEEFRRRGRNDILVSPVAYSFSAEEIRAEGLKVRLPGRKYRINYNRILRCLPKRLRIKLGLFILDDVDVVLDASGFLYGDQWPLANIKIRIGNDLQHLRKNNTKLVLLPQAFGPFSRDEIKDEFGKILQLSSLVFARDPQSFGYLTETYGNLPKIRQAPDFTNLVSVSSDKRLSSSTGKPRLAIIPNIKIIVHQEEKAATYYSMLTKIATMLSSKYEVFFLIHEGADDAGIAHEICNKAGLDLEIIQQDDPLELKRIIKECYGIVTGRFHGLVSALSQGIPALATGWSHKYVELLKDYDYSEGLLEISDSPEYLQQKLELFARKEKYDEVRSRIAERAAIEKEKTRAMWDTVFEVIS